MIGCANVGCKMAGWIQVNLDSIFEHAILNTHAAPCIPRNLIFPLDKFPGILIFLAIAHGCRFCDSNLQSLGLFERKAHHSNWTRSNPIISPLLSKFNQKTYLLLSSSLSLMFLVFFNPRVIFFFRIGKCSGFKCFT